MLARVLKTAWLRKTIDDKQQYLWELAGTPAYIMQSKWGLSIGTQIKIDSSNQKINLHKMTLLLASYKEGSSFSIGFQDNSWLLWCYYDESLSDQEIEDTHTYQLNLTQFFEKNELSPVNQVNPEFVEKHV